VAVLVSSAARDKNLSLQSYVASDVPPVLRGDAGQLRQVLLNLTGNAVKFTETGGVVLRASLEPSADARVVVRFAVSDTGIGLSKDALTRLFEPFTQADNSTTRQYGGTGLGLSISKRLVELMGGEIGVEPNEDAGTTFLFTACFDPAAQSEPSLRACSFEGVRVLVVDPDVIARYFP